MKLAVIGPTLEFGKGSYILKSLGEHLESSDLQVSYLGYHDIILNTSAIYLTNRQLYRNFGQLSIRTHLDVESDCLEQLLRKVSKEHTIRLRAQLVRRIIEEK
ncbi:MAG: hypothetical protein QXO46_05770, partial [Nitrososphaerota archaeon]